MKKIITLCIFSLSFLIGKSQFVITNGDTISWNAQTSSIGLISPGSCKNIGTDTITLQWMIVADSAATGWTYTGYCDRNICYGFGVGESHIFTLIPNGSGILEIHLSTGCNPGFGYAKVLVWNVADSANSVKLVYYPITVTQSAACAAGINEVEAVQISLYPNPVRSDMKVTLPQNLSNGQIDIYNLIGSKVYSQPLISTTDFDLSSLDSGIYIARISEAGRTIVTKKFTKAE
jgi:hypothetical protein